MSARFGEAARWGNRRGIAPVVVQIQHARSLQLLAHGERFFERVCFVIVLKRKPTHRMHRHLRCVVEELLRRGCLIAIYTANMDVNDGGLRPTPCHPKSPHDNSNRRWLHRPPYRFR